MNLLKMGILYFILVIYYLKNNLVSIDNNMKSYLYLNNKNLFKINCNYNNALLDFKFLLCNKLVITSRYWFYIKEKIVYLKDDVITIKLHGCTNFEYDKYHVYLYYKDIIYIYNNESISNFKRNDLLKFDNIVNIRSTENYYILNNKVVSKKDKSFVINFKSIKISDNFNNFILEIDNTISYYDNNMKKKIQLNIDITTYKLIKAFNNLILILHEKDNLYSLVMIDNSNYLKIIKKNIILSSTNLKIITFGDLYIFGNLYYNIKTGLINNITNDKYNIFNRINKNTIELGYNNKINWYKYENNSIFLMKLNKYFKIKYNIYKNNKTIENYIIVYLNNKIIYVLDEYSNTKEIIILNINDELKLFNVYNNKVIIKINNNKNIILKIFDIPYYEISTFVLSNDFLEIKYYRDIIYNNDFLIYKNYTFLQSQLNINITDNILDIKTNYKNLIENINSKENDQYKYKNEIKNIKNEYKNIVRKLNQLNSEFRLLIKNYFNFKMKMKKKKKKNSIIKNNVDNEIDGLENKIKNQNSKIIIISFTIFIWLLLLVILVIFNSLYILRYNKLN